MLCFVFYFQGIEYAVSSAMVQAVACAPVTQRARVRSPVEKGFLGEVCFRGFPSPVRLTSGRISKGMSQCCCLGAGLGIELIPHPGRPSLSLCDQKCIYVIQSQFPLPTGLSSVRPGRRESRKGAYNEGENTQ